MMLSLFKLQSFGYNKNKETSLICI